MRRAVGEAEQFVDLLLILGEHQLGLAVIEQIVGFLIEHVAVQTEAEAADRMGGDFGRDPVGPVVADDADHVAAAEAEFDHAEREVVHAGLIIGPGEHPPQPEILFAQCDFGPEFRCVEPQQFRKGVGCRDAAGIVHHATRSAAVG